MSTASPDLRSNGPSPLTTAAVALMRGVVDRDHAERIWLDVVRLQNPLRDHVAVLAAGRVLAAGTVDEVRAGMSLEDRFVELVGGRRTGEGLEWLHRS